MAGSALNLVIPQAALPDPRPNSYRYWERYSKDQLGQMRQRIDTVLDDFGRQFDLFAPAEPAPVKREAAPVTAPLALAPAATVDRSNDLGAVLSPSSTKLFLFTCSARWWFRYGAGLPDPPSGSLVRGRVVHKVAEWFFRAKKAGQAVDPDELAQPFEAAWDEAAQTASFHKDDDVELLKRQAAVLARKYLDEAAPDIQPAEIELPVSGTIGGVPVRGIVDLLDTNGRIVDLKTAARKPSGVSPDYAFQLATYRAITPGASGKVRIDTLVATKTPQLVTIPYEVSLADQFMAEKLYPHVREGIREGLFFPNRCSNLCSRKTCNFWQACQAEFGGTVKGDAE
jgi:hypothetical protein